MHHRRIPLLTGAVLVTLSVISLMLAAVPLLVILPFVSQRPWMLSAAHRLTRVSPPASLALLVVSVSLAWRLGRSLPVRGRFGLGLLVIPVAAASILSWTNYVEFIFPTAPRADLAAIAEFRDVGDGDMVLGVVRNGAARAYPVRYLAYHHLVNDELGGASLLPTY
jgi:hypothetical protein